MRQTGDQGHGARNRALFARIARHYDKMNRIMSFGRDLAWRREALECARLPRRGRLLDLGTGTGDLVLEALRRDPSLRAVAGDVTIEMVRIARARDRERRVGWLIGDALALPFGESVFDAVTSAYLMRNVANIPQAWAEQYRVLRPGGYVVCLDTTPPLGGLRHLPARLYLRFVVPVLGQIIVGDGAAYSYLPRSTARFLKAEELAACMQEAGFQDVQYRRFMFGAMAIHWGRK